MPDQRSVSNRDSPLIFPIARQFAAVYRECMPSTAQIEWTPTRQAILGPDPALVIYGEISVWFHKLELFRREEEDRMFQRDPGPEDLEIHRSLVVRLIADGEHLLALIQQNGGLIQNREGIKAEDVRAAVNGLHESVRGWHANTSAERRNQILADVFSNVP
jgi:hypothetical protein